MSLPIQRDFYGRPYIIPETGGKAVRYTRVSTFAETLEDGTGLCEWKQQKVALGLTDNPELSTEVDAARGDWTAMKAVCAKARDLAGANTASDYGNTLHKLTEYVDMGWQLGALEPSVQADVDAYVKATEGVKTLAVERFTVCDEMRLAGTPDRIQKARLKLPDGTELDWQGIGDVKTGKLYLSKFAVQLAVYAHSRYYALVAEDQAVRTAPPAIDQKWALLTHLPAGEARADFYLLDIEAGWKAAQEALWVRKWRSGKDLVTKVTLGG